MTRYELRQMAALVYGVAFATMQHEALLFLAHERHAAGDDEGSVDALESARGIREGVLDDYFRSGGKAPRGPREQEQARERDAREREDA